MFKDTLIGIDFSSQFQQLLLFGHQLSNYIGSTLVVAFVFGLVQQRGSLCKVSKMRWCQEYFRWSKSAVNLLKMAFCPLQSFFNLHFLNELAELSDYSIDHLAGIAYFFATENHFIHINNNIDPKPTTSHTAFREVRAIMAYNLSEFFTPVNSKNILDYSIAIWPIGLQRKTSVS